MKRTPVRDRPILHAATLFSLFFLPALLVVVLVSAANYRREVRAETTLVEQNEALLVGFERTLIANQLNTVLEDLDYVAGEIAAADFRTFLERNPEYSALSLVNRAGFEELKLLRNQDIIIEDPSLADVSAQPYFQSATTMSPDQVFVSRLDFEEGTAGRGPAFIRFVAPVKEGNTSAFVVLTFRASQIIRQVREASAMSFGHTMLLDPDGYWLHSPRPGDLAGTIGRGGSARTFADDYPGPWETITKMDAGVTSGHSALFVFTTVYPLMDPVLDAPNIHREVVHDFSEEEGYYWHLVSFVPESMIRSRTAQSRNRIVLTGMMFGIGFMVFSAVVAVMRRKRVVTEWRVAEEASIFAHNPAPVLRADADGRIVKANPAAHLAFIGDTVTDQSLDLFSALDEEAIESIKLGHSYQFEQKLGDAYYYFSAKRDPGDGSLLFYGSDITSRKEIQREISRLSAAVEQSATSILITDLTGHITFANSACARISGYPVDELIGMHTRVFRSGEQPAELYREMWSVIAAGGVWTGEMHNRKKDGTLYWEEMSITPIREDSGAISGYLAVKEDITKRKETERQLTRAKEEAESASRLKSEFLANMSHEIRTPMNAILGFTDFLIDDEDAPDRLKNLKIIKSSGKHLLALINDILDFSKIEADRIDIEIMPFAFRGMLEHIEGLMSESIKNKGLYLHTELAEDVPAVVRGDEHRITQILLNLLGNAVKFTDTGGITIRCSYDAKMATIAIIDTGVGIEKAKLEEIFNPFQQANASTERTHGGTGLGLAICRRLSDLMQGSILVESTPGTGSTFFLEVPLPEVSVNDVEFLEVVDETEPAAEPVAGQAPDGKMVAAWLDTGNEKLRQVVLKGIRDLPVKLDKLKRAAAEGDLQTFSNIAHDLKGYTGNLHLTEAYTAAEALYARVRKDDFDLKEAPLILAEFESVVARIPRSVLQAESTGAELSTGTDFEMRILTAEDNETNQELVRILLDGLGLESDFVTNGKAVLEKLDTAHYDLLLLDMQMPVMDGIETIQRIRGRRGLNDLHVIAVTAHAMEGDEERCLELGCNDYLAKPIDRKVFRDKIGAVAAGLRRVTSS